MQDERLDPRVQVELANKTARESQIAMVSPQLGERMGDTQMMEHQEMRLGKQWRETMLREKEIMAHC